MQSDLFAVLKSGIDKFDLIISNPPYVSTEEFDSLANEVYFEPELALKAGRDGLDFYRRIIPQVTTYLNDNGLLIFEVGFNRPCRVAGHLDMADRDFTWLEGGQVEEWLGNGQGDQVF